MNFDSKKRVPVSSMVDLHVSATRLLSVRQPYNSHILKRIISYHIISYHIVVLKRQNRLQAKSQDAVIIRR